MTGSFDADIALLLTKIDGLPDDWHASGSVSLRVLETIAKHGRGIKRSIETGTGRTTLLLSHLSESHVVFTKDDEGDGDSLKAVRSSDLLRSEAVTFVLGPTQKTILGYDFAEPLDLAYLDGPHAYPFPELEYWAVYPHLATGGLLVVDDIQIPTIANLFRFLRADAMWDLAEVVDTTAFFLRTDAPGIDPFGEGWWLQGYNRQPVAPHLSATQRVIRDVRVRAGAMSRQLRGARSGSS